MNRQTDIAYLAGFFDGEGSVYIVITKKGYVRIEVSISQKHRAVLNWIVANFGGKIYQSKGYYPQWKINGSKAVEFLLLLRTFLIEKAIDVEDAVKIWNVRHDKILAREILSQRMERRGGKGKGSHRTT